MGGAEEKRRPQRRGEGVQGIEGGASKDEVGASACDEQKMVEGCAGRTKHPRCQPVARVAHADRNLALLRAAEPT